jgi:hypothetical protein
VRLPGSLVLVSVVHRSFVRLIGIDSFVRLIGIDSFVRLIGIDSFDRSVDIFLVCSVFSLSLSLSLHSYCVLSHL